MNKAKARLGRLIQKQHIWNTQTEILCHVENAPTVRSSRPWVLPLFSLSLSHLCPNLWHTDLPCTAVCYLTLNCHVLCFMTGCCCSQSWTEMWGMHVCSTTTEWTRTTKCPRVPLALLEWEEFKSIGNDAILPRAVFSPLHFFMRTCMAPDQLLLKHTASNIKYLGRYSCL